MGSPTTSITVKRFRLSSQNGALAAGMARSSKLRAADMDNRVDLIMVYLASFATRSLA